MRKIKLVLFITLNITIMRNAFAQPCKADFNYMVWDTSNSYQFEFKGPYSSANNFTWDFGDGVVSKGPFGYAFHKYSKKGNYSACLVRDSASCSDTICLTVMANGTNPCTTEIIEFQDTSNYLKWTYTVKDSTKESYNWEAPKKDTGLSMSYTFSSPGYYGIGIRVSSYKEHCLDTIEKIFYAKHCNAKFVSMPQDTGRRIKFINFSSSNITSHSWQFGDGTSSNLKHPIHKYNKPGNYRVFYSAYDSIYKCSDTFSIQLKVYGYCKADFSAFPSGNLGIQFWTQSSGTSFLWDFGDGKTSTTKTPGNVYAKAGQYKVTFTVYDSILKCSDSISKIIDVFDPCTAGYSFSLTDSLLTYTSSVPIQKGIVWEFGDNKYDTGASGNHIYNSIGTYAFCQKVYCFSGDSVKKCTTLITKRTPYCNLNLKLFSENDTIPYQTKLKLSTSASSYSVIWSYLNLVLSTEKDPKIKFGLANLFRIKATVFDSTNQCIDTAGSMVLVTGSLKCRAEFDFKSGTKNPYYFEFFSHSNQKYISHTWLVDNVVKSHNIGYFDYNFPYGGHFKVQLRINDTLNKCSDTIIYKMGIKVNCFRGWSRGFVSNINKFDVDFIPDSINSSYKYHWYFGDGDSSTNIKPTHGYKQAGKYNVCLYIDCGSSKMDRYCDTLLITNPCKALFTIGVDTTQKYKLFLINKSSQSSANKYFWDFGDSSYSYIRNPSHKYNSFGKFKVCLEVKDTALNCSSLYCDSLGLDSNGKLLKRSDWELVVIDETVFGIKPVQRSGFKFYPNPAHTQITIDLSNSFNTFSKLEIINVNGKQCMKRSIDSDNEMVNVDIDTLPDGLYILKLSGENAVAYEKLLKRQK
ncbi:MAG: PKD domain-containing protein [Flavobacteriales bacterium]|nr:PKD domain-containing protein [Flavobacteriales bacterium]